MILRRILVSLSCTRESVSPFSSRRAGPRSPGSRQLSRSGLRGRSVYSVDGTGGINLASYSNPQKVSLPADLSGAPELSQLVQNTSAAQYYESGTVERMLRPQSELDASPCPVKTQFWDATLKHSRKKLIGFYKDLIKINLVLLAPAGTALEQLGSFFVYKGDETQLRCIVDARRVNWRFATPPGVELCTSEGLSRIEITLPDGMDPDSDAALEHLKKLELALGIADIADAFCRFRLDRQFARYFGVGQATASELGISGQLLDGCVLEPHSVVDILWGSLPVGFSWSLLFCQVIGEAKLLRVPSLDGTLRLTDRGPPAVLDASCHKPGARAHYLYVDNMGVLGARLKTVRRGPLRHGRSLRP